MSKEIRYFLYFIIIIISIIIIIIFYRYQQYVIDRNFILKVNTFCDSNTENCFAPNCLLDDPNFECNNFPYKKIEILDKYAPKCLEEHNCSVFSCDDIKDKCSIIYCSFDILENGEKCLENIKN